MKNKGVSIPNKEQPNGDGVEYEKHNDSLFVTVEMLQNKRIQFRPMYYEQRLEGATVNCYIREEVGALLLEAVKRLPEGYSLLIYDAWRPYTVQYALYEEYYKYYKSQNPDQDEATIREEIKLFVSVPSQDANRPFVHGTGGAVDVTILDELGQELNMGTPFDDFHEQSYTAYYENREIDELVKRNRRLLYGIMTEVGFTNLPSEWWHYDYGNLFWAYYTGKKAKYKGVLDESGICTKD